MDKFRIGNFILASNSPRRRELLQDIVEEFRVIPSLFEERAEDIPAPQTAKRFAEGKAREVFMRYPQSTVLGADTVVALGGEIFGKPKNAEHAREMLRALSGKTHSVFTGVCLIKQGVFRSEIAETEVEFNPLSEELIERYVESGLPLDKAGAYGIQDGFGLVKTYRGSYTNVVGFPVELVRRLLSEGLQGDANVKACD